MIMSIEVELSTFRSIFQINLDDTTLMSGRKMIMSFEMRQPFLQIGSFLLDEGEVSLQPKSLVDPTFVAIG